MIKKAKESKAALELNLNPNLNTNWIDTINIGVRNDNLFLIRFLTELPEGIFEQSRIMTSKEHLKKLVDNLCLSMDYYPTKNEK